MAIGIAVKKDGVVYLGFDSFIEKGNYTEQDVCESNLRGFVIKELPNTLMYVDSVYRDIPIIRTNTIIPDEIVEKGTITQSDVVNVIAPNIYNILKEHFDKFPNKNEFEFRPDIILIHKDKIFRIHLDGTVVEVSNEVSLGCNNEIAMGSLYITKDNPNPEERVLEALRACAYMTSVVSKPFYLLNTKTCELKKIEE